MQVCLDSNVFILGERSPENIKLIDLTEKGIVKLFISEKVSMERQTRSHRLQDDIGQLIREEKKYSQEDFIRVYKAARDRKEKQKKSEEEELNFWRRVKPERTHSTFNGLIWMGFLGEAYINQIDIKKERLLYGQLLDKFHISSPDAFQLMEAHSAGMDYFLTWDKRLISKAKNIIWLKPKVMDPKIFVAKMASRMGGPPSIKRGR